MKQGYDVFIDVESLRSGNVDVNLMREISTRRHFVIVLSPEAVQGFAIEDDWLLKELRCAFESNLTIIPFLVGGFDFRAYGQTPIPEMEKLRDFHGIEHAGPYFTVALEKLTRFLPPANQRRNQHIAIAVSCILVLAAMAWSGYQVCMQFFSDTWIEVTHGFDDTSKETFKRFEGSLTSVGNRWSADFTERDNDDGRWQASGKLEGDKLVLNYTKGGNGNGLGVIVSKRIRDDTFQGYFIGYDRNKGDLVACPDILTKLGYKKAKEEFSDYLSSKCFHAGLIDRIRSTGKVRVGISIDINSPFVCLDENEGELSGFDVELVKLLVKELKKKLSIPNLEAEFVAYQWEKMFEAVDNRDVDLIISGITATKERMEKYKLAFSSPYFNTNKSYSYYKKFPPKNTEFKDRKVIVHGFTTSSDRFKSFPDKNKKAVGSPRAAFQLLMRNQKSGVVVTDEEIALYIISKFNLEKKIETKLLEAANEEKYGIAVSRRETDLVTDINESLKELRDSDKITHLKDQWFSENGNPKKDNQCAAPFPVASSLQNKSIQE